MRDFNDWELDMVGNLLHVLRGYKPTLEEDSVSWKEEETGSLKSRKCTICWSIPLSPAFRKVAFGWIEFQLK